MNNNNDASKLLQSVMSKLPKNVPTTSSKPTTPTTSSSSNKKESQQQQTNKKFTGKESQQQQQLPLGDEINMKEIELITKRLAQDLNSASFLSDSEDEDDDLDDDLDDEDFRKQILQEFSNVMNSQNNSNASQVSKQTLKQLYLMLLAQGPSLLTSKEQADNFFAKLSQNEMNALTDLLQKNPDEIIRFFNNDEMVKRAIENQNTINFQAATSSDSDSLRKGLWKDLTADDLRFDEDKKDDLSNREIPIAVREALKAFESNLAHYSKHPAALLQLCDKLPTTQDQTVFLDILFREYTPDKLESKLKQQQQQSETQKEQEKVVQQEFKFDGDLVAHVFKEVLTHFRVFKKHPQKFDPLLNRLNEKEREAFDSLVKVFWDLKVEQLKL
jgi:hypothetical protein